ncbi:MAG TPA: hypothetical protein PKB14_20095 [Rubrivivax sp.]|nr:hypothetical protein [Rubrivivax sp.]
MRPSTLLSCLLLTAALPAVGATRLGEACDLAVVGARDDAAFLQFDRALRGALAQPDAAGLARLVRFPLRMSFKDGVRAAPADAAALQARLPAASWTQLRKVVDAQPPARLFCNVEGVMYGDGELWASPDAAGGHAFRVSAINLSEHAPATAQGAPAQLACSTDKFAVVVDTAADGAPRYRSWNRPHGPPDAPAMELVGKASGEGSGVCFHRRWRFANGNVDYLLSEPGCNDGSVPAQAKAQLQVHIGGKAQLEAWCY